MRRLLAVATGLVTFLGCDLENSCDRLADYVCTCRSEDEGYDCDEYLSLAENPSAEVLDECILELEDLRAEDEQDGETCPI